MMKNIILGITGSIAAYKAADIANTLTKTGHSVHTIMTKAGAEFITPLTLQTLTKNKVHTDMFEAMLACGDLGKGALADVDVIVSAVYRALGE